jgi:RNA polymerase sigma factor (sigma-70 family)
VNWWQWAFDGVGGAFVLALIGWIAARVRRGRTAAEVAPAATSQHAQTGGVNVNVSSGGTITVGGQAELPYSLIKDLVNSEVERVLANHPGLRPPEPAEVEAAEAKVTSEVTDDERAHRLAKAIASLPEREKIAFTLHYYEGLTTAEIAQVVGVTAQTVGVWRKRALASLAAELGDDLANGPLWPGSRD